MSLTTITVTGSYPAGAGSEVATGYVTFVPSARIVNASGHTIIPQLPVQVPLQLGVFSLPVVVCTDNAGLTPTGWAWQVTENINGVQADPYYVFIPSSYGASVDLSELAEAQAGPVITTYAQVGAANTFTEPNVFSDGVTVAGTFELDGTTIVTPPGGSTDFLRGDGTWASPGGGSVDSVNDQTGVVVLTAANVGADTAGSAVAAQANAESFATAAVAAETTRAEAAEATKLTAADNLSDLGNPASARTNLDLGTGATANIDATAADIQPLGAAGAGSTGRLADAGHRHPYEPWQFYVAAYGAKGDNVTDDTASIRSAIAAAFNYAVAGNGYAEIVFDPLTYLLAAAPITGATFNGATFSGSAQLPIPAQPQTAQKLAIVFRGTREQTGLYHWLQTTPQRAGTVLRSTWNAGDTIPATGEASVIGGPTPYYMGDPPSAWSNELVVIDGITIEIDDYNICGFDFRDIAEANVINASVLALSTVTGAPAVPPANWAFGLAMPVVNNNDNCNIGWFSVEGLVYGLIVYEHVEAASVRIINCFDGLVCWSSSGFPHRNHIAYASIEGCQRCIVLAGGFNKLDIDLADLEWGGSYIIDDVGSITGVGRINLASNGDSGASLSAALNTSPTNVNVLSGPLTLEITNLDQPLGPVTPPSVPGSTAALTNPFWRSAEIHVSGGTVTQVAIDGVSQLSTSGSFTVPPGHTITLTYSAAPSWAWTLTR